MDWILLTYKLHGDIENMIVPPARHPPKPNWHWAFYIAYAVYKAYSFSKPA